MTRTESIRKLLALGDLYRPDLEIIMGGDKLQIDDALAELHTAGDLLYVKDGRQQVYFRLTDEARAAAFA